MRTVTDATRRKIAESRKGKPSANRGVAMSEKQKQKISSSRRARLTAIGHGQYSGAGAGDAFAAVLCPVGFKREHHIQWGRGNERFIVDFAHVESKVAIELDGPGHKTPLAKQQERDLALKNLGWRVIHIKHGFEFSQHSRKRWVSL